MPLTNSMNHYPLKHIPQIWLIHLREHLEAHHETLDDLRYKINRFTSSRNIEAVLDVADSLDQLRNQMKIMEDVLEAHYPTSNEYNPYNKNDLRRIKELATTTSYQLRAIAAQISWCNPHEKQVGQVQRNLHPLIELLEKIIMWLEQAI